MLKLDVMNHLETLKRTRTIGIHTVRMALLAPYAIPEYLNECTHMAIDTIVFSLYAGKGKCPFSLDFT